jgi:2-methylisocitrate lyase-like PEP mutase family enzyme
MKKTTELRELIKNEDIVVLPGVYDCLSARLAEEAGFQAVLLTGAGIVASLLGYPDFGLISMTEVLNHTRNIVGSVNIPVFADCDTGYGNPINVFRTIREFERAGVAGLFIEDQVFPKRCGHFEKKQVLSKEEMVKKIEAAIDARVDPELVIMARIDSRAVFGIDDALKRANAYAKAGADMVFVEAPETIDELRMIPNSVSVPVMVNLVEGGKTPLLSVEELRDFGFKFASFSGSAQKIAIKAMQELFGILKSTGSLESAVDRIVSLDDRSRLLGLNKFYKMEVKYGVRED